MSTLGREAARAGSSFAQAQRAARFILARTQLRPRIAIVLGSGLGAVAEELADATSIAYQRIPNFPVATAIGHAGRLILGQLAGVPVAVMQGRVHFYEGYAPEQVIFPMRVLSQAGIRAVILTNAAGGISRQYRKGSLVLLRDHINLQGASPLVGPNDARFGVRFPDLTRVHWERYREFAREEAGKQGLEIFEGIYAAVSGPNYETPAEIRYLRTIGADLVGMSTVPEIIAAAHLGMRVLGISCVTNMAAGVSTPAVTQGRRPAAVPITAEEVLETAQLVQQQLAALLRAIVPRIAVDLDVCEPGSGDTVCDSRAIIKQDVRKRRRNRIKKRR